MAKRPVGEASVKISVDGVDQVKKDLNDVKAQTEQVGESGRQGFGKLDDAVGRVGQRIEDSTQGLRRFQGAISGIIGVVTGLAGSFAFAFGAIIADIKKAEEKLKDLRRSVDETRESARSASRGFNELADSIDTSLVNDEVERSLEENTDAIQKYQRAIDDEIRRIDASLSKLRQAGRGGGGEASQLESERQQLIESGDRLIRALERQGIERTRALREAQEEAARQEEERIRAEEEREQQRLRKEQQAEFESALVQAMREVAEESRRLQQAVQEQVKTANDNRRELEKLNQRITNFTPSLRKGAEGLTRRQRT